MKTNDDMNNHIDNYIHREKKTEPNPFLSSLIMSKIQAPLTKRMTVWHSIAVAASISIVIFLGFRLGGMTDISSNDYSALNINDSEIENFIYFNNETYE
jgi:type VI protein secretion system component VasF